MATLLRQLSRVGHSFVPIVRQLQLENRARRGGRSVVEVEVLRRFLLEPELVVLGSLLEEVGGLLEHVLLAVGGGWLLGLWRRLRLQRLVELVGEALLVPEVVVLLVLLLCLGDLQRSVVGVLIKCSKWIDWGQARLFQALLDQLLLGGRLGLRGGEFLLDVVHLGRLLGDRLALLGGRAGGYFRLGRGLWLGSRGRLRHGLVFPCRRLLLDGSLGLGRALLRRRGRCLLQIGALGARGGATRRPIDLGLRHEL